MNKHLGQACASINPVLMNSFRIHFVYATFFARSADVSRLMCIYATLPRPRSER